MRLPRFSFDLWLGLLGLAALFCLSPFGSAVAVVAAISIIGIPIALAMAAIPTLFLFLLLARFAFVLLPVGGVAGMAVAALLALAALAVPPLFENRRLAADADSLAAADIRAMPKPAVKTLAVVALGSGRPVCDELCQRALLNGVVERIVMAAGGLKNQALDDSLAGKMFRLERRAQCPPFDLQDGVGTLTLSGEQRGPGDRRPSDFLRLRAAEGLCLVEEPATLADADGVLATVAVRRGKRPATAGLWPFADTVSATRISFHLRENGRLVERYRSTGVVYYPLLPIVAPSYAGGYGLELKAGLLRRTAFRGEAKQYAETPPIEPVLEGVLGFDLALRDDRRDLTASVRSVIAAALDRSGPVERSAAKVVQDFFAGFDRNRPATVEDAELALRVLADRRVPVPREAWAAVKGGVAADPALAARFAAVLFDRLPATDPQEREDHPTYLGYTLAYLSSAIVALPDAALLPYRAPLEALAHDPAARVRAYGSLSRLGVFGADAAPTLLYLIEDAARYRGKGSDHDAWQHPYLAGLQGLCRMGAEGAAATPRLLQNLETGVMVKHASYWRLTIHTLVGLGASAGEIWPYLQTSDKNHSLARFEKEVAWAGRKRDCGY